MAAEVDSASSAPPQKFSRYRSVRQGASKPPPVFLSQNNQDVGVSRAPSRYRRARSTSKPEHPPQQNPSTPTLPSNGFATSTAQRRTTAPLGGPVVRPQLDRKFTEPRESESERRRRQAQEAIIREEQAYRLRKEKEERDRIAKIQRAEQEAQQARLTEEEAAIILKENKRRDLERLEAELAAAPPPSTVQSPKDRFGFFSRKKTSAARSAPPPVTRNGSMPPVLRTKSNDTPAIGIMEGGGGIVPGTDAPMSAVNAGERRVLIRCKQSSITLPITPETTPKDLVFTAANILTQNINPAGAILLESYAQLGLERRIRRYEPIRDVMNSWDRDTQNCLILENSDSPAHDRDTLEAHSIPREPPGDVRVFMYHSQKPGRWAKRNITLLSSGQIYISRKAGAKMGEKDTINLCHLSDFDIYTPTPQQIRKTLRPPKKHCYAIKSQQKTTMFLNTENFVHFFCTDDETLANEWYSAVQAWRSWYLVHKKGEGRKISKSTTQTSVTTQSSLTAPEIRLRPATKAGPNHSRQVSVDENPYTIGSFTPLINPERFESPPSLPSQPPPDYEEYDSEDENRPRQIPFHLRNVSPEKPHTESKRYRPPVSYRGPLDMTQSDGEFASGGLLGRTYTLRQKAQQERERANGPFVDGPSLINNSVPPTTTHHRSNSIRNNSMRNNSMRNRPVTSGGPRPVTSGGQNASGLQRTPSKREKPAPLLDFTPTFVEAPQWNKAGKGHGVAAPLGVPLVEAATNPEMGPMDDIPKATTLFRREEPLATRPATARPPTSGGRTRSLQGAFVKGGLIGKIEAENAGNSK